ncbi:hypothetical protein IB258_05890 [Achromobacter sp. ACM02]|uniref:hypothetical protein n=1 Tax=unclassified Achromobacter TaxID=2626865 RepID=UPI0011C3B6D5|nr:MULTISPECIES: hypothetical protein [unclassified Achromobacter]MBD9380760.1 hypothetical protein [Achromobacter sp. ACM02]
MNKSLADGDELYKVIEEFSDLEWRKFQTRMVMVRLKGGGVYQRDNSKAPPFTTIRFRVENREFVEELRKAVEGYEGDMVWKMFPHQRLMFPDVNWVIRPAFVDEAVAMAGGDVGNSQDFMSEHYPDFALKAYKDMLGLAEHVRKELEKKYKI